MGSIDRDLPSELSLEEAVNLLSGHDFWHTRANEALGLGSLKFSDGPNGVRGEDWINGAPSAAIPCGTALGASFDVELVTKLAGVLARECKRKGVHGLLAPTMNTHRYPLCGRNFESFSEDPLLSGLIAASFVNGLQAQGIATSPKHFLANEAENGRRWSDSIIDERALREIYLEPFRIVVEQADPWSIMTAYNSVNGSFCSESQNLLSILRDEWRYNGAVISDWFGTYSTTEAFNAGLDLEMPGPTKFREYNKVLKAIRKGEVQRKQITDSAARIVDLLRKTGRAGEPGFPPPLKAEEPDYLDDVESRALIRQAAESSMVLLKNGRDTLPLLDRATRLAVFGHHATEPSLFGGGSASLKVPYTSTPWEVLSKTYCNATLGAGVAVNRLVPLPNESGLGIENITLLWYNGDQPSPGQLFHRQEFKDTLYMLVEHAPDGLLDRSDFCTTMKFELVAQKSGFYNLSLSGPGSAKCLLDDKVVLDVERDLNVSTEDFLFDRSKLEVCRDEPLLLEAGRTYKFEVVSWSSKHKAQNVTREFFIQGCRLGLALASDDNLPLASAKKLAETVDTALIVVGTGTEWESEGFDRVSMKLPRRQDELILRVAKACQGKTIVVVNAGSPIDTSAWIDEVDAVIYAWFPGMEFGNALARVVSGEVSPCARLPTTFWDTVEDYPAGHVESLMTPNKEIHYREGIHVGYRQQSLETYNPRFAFGHGLSYTTFSCSITSPTYLAFDARQETNKVVMRVTNTGSRAASQTVLLFIEALEPATPRPSVELRAFAKMEILEPGASQDLEFCLKVRDFSYWDVKDHLWRVDAGNYRLRVAGPHGVGDWREIEDVTIRIEERMTVE
ncbi:beta-glucosidase H [Fusarium tjaetaba]|uniref:beta-glucosidase n=1 Tax=Fusarium tjaetaba TaxID=1567544 RepID=A0A8H5QY62_9HYPO|nr:beta-glucosidase H [Fusarium tjaetaba]KAF5622718.1 beta-glucosidase H [Fusarium tjaetaba]